MGYKHVAPNGAETLLKHVRPAQFIGSGAEPSSLLQSAGRSGVENRRQRRGEGGRRKPRESTSGVDRGVPIRLRSGQALDSATPSTLQQSAGLRSARNDTRFFQESVSEKCMTDSNVHHRIAMQRWNGISAVENRRSLLAPLTPRGKESARTVRSS